MSYLAVSDESPAISSLHIGQASLELAAAATAGLSTSLCSNEILELRSCASVEGWEVEAEELTERVLSEGESRLESRAGYVGAGARFRPLPSTRPPPSFRADIFHRQVKPYKGWWILRLSGTGIQRRGCGLGVAGEKKRRLPISLSNMMQEKAIMYQHTFIADDVGGLSRSPGWWLTDPRLADP